MILYECFTVRIFYSYLCSYVPSMVIFRHIFQAVLFNESSSYRLARV